MANQFGLIGYPLGHSFSKKYFSDKFKKSQSSDSYELYELIAIDELADLLKSTHLKGLNVTIPYKQQVIPFLHTLDRSANLVGAVNVIKVKENELIGYNTDYPAFRSSLKKWLDHTNIKALVLGTGGASKAVIAALNDLKIQYQQVSRTQTSTNITYEELASNNKWIQEFELIINTTPLGMAPNFNNQPDIPYQRLTSKHCLYDLVYNPLETRFLASGRQSGCKTKNGIEMLELQAELAWDIWHA